MPRSADLAVCLFVLGALAVAGTFVDAARGVAAAEPGLAGRAALVERLGLTDLALFTEARYTRHPSQADRHAPFQDHPFAFEHFPSGAVMPPPRPQGSR
ncbi:MAG: hypothetical protein ACM3Q1_15990 [Bacteroidales bacterium]